MSCNCENCSARREGRSTITYRTYASGGVVKAELADTTFDAFSSKCFISHFTPKVKQYRTHTAKTIPRIISQTIC